MDTSAWNLRAMTPDDFPAALALWRSTEGVGLSAADEPRSLATFLDRNPGLSAVGTANDDGRLLGTVLAGDDGRRGFLYHLAVVPEVQRRGLARALVEHAASRLAARGIEKCNILVYSHNASGLAFWRHLGWGARPDLTLLQLPLAGRHGG